MGKNETNNGKKGGLLKGKPHYDKNGKPLGGIKAIVTDTNTPVELEGGEVIINKEASKKYWRELSKINQSAGNGVPIKNPNGSFDEDPEEYKDGGNVIQFNPNHTPSKIILNYAKKIKSDYPKVWDKGGNIFGNEAFNNLNRVSERGYWLDSEKWMYIKWRSYVARHKQDFRINGVVAMLKWVDKVDRGWSYMKDLIESEIDKKYPTKMAKGGQVVTYKNKFNKKYGFDEDESHSLKEISKIAKIKLSSLQDIYDKGIGAYKTNPESVRPNVKSKEQWAMARVYSSIMGGKASKVDANELTKGKMAKGGLIAPNGNESNLTPKQYKLVRTPEFKAWFGDWENDPENASKVLDENGEPLMVYHGTTHKFFEFTKERGNIENHFGLAYYFSSSKLDIEQNYLSVGADLTSRIERLTEQLEDSKISREKAKAKAIKLLKGKKEIILDCFLNFRNPINITKNGTRYDALEIENEDGYYEENEDSLPMKLYESIRTVSYEYGGVDFQGIFNDIAESLGSDWDYALAYDVDKAFRQSPNLFDVTDDLGNLASYEFIRRVYEEMGFDGIIMDANLEFGSLRKQGKSMIMDEDTLHYMAFESNQIKLADGTNTTFDANNPDIRLEVGGRVKESIKKMKQKNVVKPDYSNNDEVSKENIEMVVNQNKQILHHTEELKKAINSGAQVPAWVVAKINRAANDMSDATHYLDGTLRYAFGGNIQSGQMYDWTKYGVENTIYVTEVKDEMVFYKLNGVNKVRGMKEFIKFLEDNNLKAGFELKDGGEIPKGIKEEEEHKMVLNELYQRKITPEQSLEIIAKDHVAKDPKYYSKLEKYGLQSGGTLVNPKDKVDYDLKSDAFVNTEIFKSEMDYIIGGFMVDELNKIRVVGDTSALNMAKLDAIFTKRLELAIESFKSSIVSLDDNGFIESDDTNEDIVNEINNMFETYLGITFISADTEAIVDIIKRDTSYLTWVTRIETRLNSFKSRLNYNVEDVIMSDTNKMSIKEIEYLTLNSTLEDIFEQLYQVNEQNTI
jgi:hypothetical protein